MLNYYFRLALYNIRRAPLLYALVIITIAIGVGALLANLALIRTMTADPIPEKSDKLFHISMNTWDDVQQLQQPKPISRYADMKAIEDSGIATHFIMTYFSASYVRVADSSIPGRHFAGIRAVSPDFFPAMSAPFAQGAGFTEALAEEIVLGHAFNQELFGDSNSIGKQIDIDGKPYTVVGVLKPWNLRPKFYTVGYGIDFSEDDDLFIPVETALDANLRPRLQISSSEHWSDMSEARDKFVYFFHGWVQLDSDAQRHELQRFMDGYSQQMKEAGKHPLPIINKLHDVPQWIKEMEVVDERVLAFSIATALFLLVCLFNSSSLLLARYESTIFETGLQRALGASKKQVFSQGAMESIVVGLISALLALVLGWLFLKVSVTFLPDLERMAVIDAGIVGIGIAIALITTFLCSVYPLWRTSQRSISLELKG